MKKVLGAALFLALSAVLFASSAQVGKFTYSWTPTAGDTVTAAKMKENYDTIKAGVDRAIDTLNQKARGFAVDSQWVTTIYGSLGGTGNIQTDGYKLSYNVMNGICFMHLDIVNNMNSHWYQLILPDYFTGVYTGGSVVVANTANDFVGWFFVNGTTMQIHTEGDTIPINGIENQVITFSMKHL
jgi:hypothetical protein